MKAGDKEPEPEQNFEEEFRSDDKGKTIAHNTIPEFYMYICTLLDILVPNLGTKLE